MKKNIATHVDQIDKKITGAMAAYGITFLRLSVGIIFLWFGFLKFFPGVSSAEQLAVQTISTLSGGMIGAHVSLPLLATWETLIGLGLLLRIYLRATLLLLFLQMVGTLSPLVLFPHRVFTVIPFVPTLEGQYIIKNLVIISAGLVIGATVRGQAILLDAQGSRARPVNMSKLIQKKA